MKQQGVFCLLLLLAVGAGAGHLQPEQFLFTPKVSGKLFENTPYIGSAYNLPESGKPGMAADRLQRAIATGNTLGGIGVTMWTTGLIMRLVATINGNSMSSDGAAQLAAWGSVLSILGPIPSCIGESIVIGTANRVASQGVAYYTRGWTYYKYSWALTVTSFALSILSYSMQEPVIGYVALGVSLGAEAFRGCAAIVPLVRFHEIAAETSFHIVPGIDYRGNRFIALSMAF